MKASPSSPIRILILFFCGIALPLAAQAQLSGISYSLSPSGEYVFFDRDTDAGLDGGLMYGGEIGIGFGRYLELTGQYMLGQDYRTNFALASDEDRFADLIDFDGRRVDLQQYGGRLQLNVGSGSFVPFVSVGSGILQFDPDGLSSSRNIYATLGGGLVYTAAGRYTLTLSGQGMAYRYNPGTAFYSETELGEAGLTAGTGQRDVFIPSLRAGLAIHLGGRMPGETSELDRALLQQFGQDGTGARIFVEPFYGRIQFNDALMFPKNQNLAGVNAGIELGPYVGLRGYYWRGMTGEEDVFDQFAEGFENIAFYGGELNLRFGSPLGARSFVPYAILGGGYMDVLGGYQDDIPPATLPPEDRYYATVGGGLEVPLSPRIKLQGDVRSLLMTTEDLNVAGNPENVYGSWMYSAGLEFSLGGGRGTTPGSVLEDRLERERLVGEERDVQLREELLRLQSRLDSLERIAQRRDVPVEDRTVTDLQRDVERLERELDPEAEVQVDTPAREAPGVRRTNLSGETITLPIPEVGEIYIRIGELDGQPGSAQQPLAQDGALSQEAIRAIVQQAVQQEVAQADAVGADLSSEEIENLVRQVIRQEIQEAEVAAADISLSQIEQRLSEEAADRRALEQELIALRRELAEGRRPSRTPEVIVETDDGQRTVVRQRQGFLGGREVRGVMPYTGLRFGDGPAQVMMAVRADLRQPRGWIRVIPEIGIGFGGGRSVNVLVSGAVPVGGRFLGPFSPYVGAGVGVITNDWLSGIRPGINLMGGVEYDVGMGAAFAEFSTFNFLNTNRVLAGYRFRF